MRTFHSVCISLEKKKRVGLSSFRILSPKTLNYHLSTFYPQLGCASTVPPMTTPLQKLETSHSFTPTAKSRQGPCVCTVDCKQLFFFFFFFSNVVLSRLNLRPLFLSQSRQFTGIHAQNYTTELKSNFMLTVLCV